MNVYILTDIFHSIDEPHGDVAIKAFRTFEEALTEYRKAVNTFKDDNEMDSFEIDERIDFKAEKAYFSANKPYDFYEIDIRIRKENI